MHFSACAPDGRANKPTRAREVAATRAPSSVRVERPRVRAGAHEEELAGRANVDTVAASERALAVSAANVADAELASPGALQVSVPDWVASGRRPRVLRDVALIRGGRVLEEPRHKFRARPLEE